MRQLSPVRFFKEHAPALPLKRKISLFVALLLFLAIFAVGVLSYSIAVDQVVEKVTESQLGLVRQVANNLDQLLNDAEDLSSLIVIDPGVQQNLQKQYLGPKPLYYPDSFSYLDKIMAVKSYISMITIYGYNGLNYSVGTDVTGSSVVSFREFQKNPLFSRAVALNGAIGIEYFNNIPQVTYDNRISRIVLYRMIRDINDYHNLGVLLVRLNENKLRAMYQMSIPAGGSISIVDQRGTIISSSAPRPIVTKAFKLVPLNRLNPDGATAESVQINGKKMLLTLGTSQLSGWKIVALTPAAILTEKISSIALVILMVSIVCYILMLVFSGYITSIITNPLQQLLGSIKKVQQGDFTQQVSFTGRDEIGELGRGYNAMLVHIRDLIERVYKLQIHEREDELNALQAQINPHFLYNTLDTIFWKAEKNQVPEISEMVYALSKIFRLSLNRGNDLTTVAQEQELIQYYLALQKIRFKEKLRYEINLEPDLLNLTIPKLILQPFVENAIIHGIEELENGGMILISGRLQDRMMIFTIRDNGVGMSEEKIARILWRGEIDSVNPAPVSGGYAIRNVLERLELYYSSQYHLEFQSNPGAGTTVTIQIPTQMKQVSVNE